MKLTIEKCIRLKRCPICNKRVGALKCFLVGPMMAITRTSIEPPAHPECAARHADAFKTEGVIALWTTKACSLFDAGNSRRAFRLGGPESVGWQKDGHQATRGEVREALVTAGATLEPSCENSEEKDRLKQELDAILQLADLTTTP